MMALWMMSLLLLLLVPHAVVVVVVAPVAPARAPRGEGDGVLSVSLFAAALEKRQFMQVFAFCSDF